MALFEQPKTERKGLLAGLTESLVAEKARGDRNNNPGNLEDGDFTRSQPGYAGTDGRFAKFATPEQGEAAQIALIRDGKRYKGKPISQIIQTYAPPASTGGDNSELSVRNYIGYVAARAGIGPDDAIPPEAYGRVAAAMREFENGRTQRIKFNAYDGAVGGGSGQSGGGTGMAQPTQVKDD